MNDYLRPGITDNSLEEQLILAEEKKDPNAQFLLGESYYYGKGVERNYAEAMRWYYKAAENGLVKAQYLLGVFYRYGSRGLIRDESKAKKWFEKAASLGCEEAIRELER